MNAAPATPRKAMTAARRARIVARDGSVCARLDCDCTIGLEVDHVIALELTGADEDHNLQLLCGPHHKAKTALDLKMIARARRLRKKADPATRKPSRMKSRGFQKDGPKAAWPSKPFPKRKSSWGN